MLQLYNALAATLAARPPHLTWLFQADGHWWPFRDLNTRYPSWSHLYGVYVIANNAGAVKVGQGQIMDRLYRHQDDPRISHPSRGLLSVTWAAVRVRYVDGVKRYLANELVPFIGDAYPDVEPIPVSLPLPFTSSRDRLIEAMMKQNGLRNALDQNPYFKSMTN